MTRSLLIEVSGFDEQITADFHEGDVAPFCDQLWEELSVPQRYLTWHTYSTGDYFMGFGRPSRQPSKTGSQAIPLGKATLLCDELPGTVMYDGPAAISFKYGEFVTEPLPCLGPAVATVSDLDLLYRAGRYVWEGQTRRHEMITVTVSRKES